MSDDTVSKENPMMVPIPDMGLVVAITSLEIDDEGSLYLETDYDIKDLEARGHTPEDVEKRISEIILGALQDGVSEEWKQE